MAKANNTPKVVASVDDQVKKFFEDYPDAPKVLKVGDSLFLPIHAGPAKEFAQRNETKVEEIENPNLGKRFKKDAAVVADDATGDTADGEKE